MTMLLNHVRPDEVKIQLPNLRHVTHVFIPITDARPEDRAEGGTHWSLLLVSIVDLIAFHYDSLGTVNLNEGRQACRAMSTIIGKEIRFHNIDDCPQQCNSSDCGVYVCILMRHLLVKRLLNANAREKVSMSMSNKLIDAKGGRTEMTNIIENLRREGQRRRSASPFARKDKDGPPRID